MIQIRPLTESDFGPLLDLFTEFAHFEKMPHLMVNTLEKMHLEKEFLTGFVAVTPEGEIVGYATCFFAYYTWKGKSLYMDDLYVKPEHRGKGLGTQLINRIIAFAKAEHCVKVRWQVSDWNTQHVIFTKA